MSQPRRYFTLCPGCETILQDERPAPGDIGRCPECRALLRYSDAGVLEVVEAGGVAE